MIGPRGLPALLRQRGYEVDAGRFGRCRRTAARRRIGPTIARIHEETR